MTTTSFLFDYVSLLKDYVCGAKGVNCSWGRAIAVADRYIYVTQPNKDRVLVISNIQMVVVDVSIFGWTKRTPLHSSP